MALTDTAARSAKPDAARPAGYKLTDGGGMFLLVKPAGKYWRMAYRYAGKQKTLALGVYPQISLAAARKARDKARDLLAQNVDPGLTKKAEKATAHAEAESTFEAVAREFHATQIAGWSPGHAARWMRRLDVNVFPHIGMLPLAKITPPMVLEVLQRMERRGVGETVQKASQACGQVFRYGVQTGRCERSLLTPTEN